MPTLEPKGRNDSHVFDYSLISDKLYVGSDFCTGRSCKVHREEFEKLNIGVEINLSIEKKEMPPENVSSYSWIPVVDGYAPTTEQLSIGTSIINEAIENEQGVYVHCKNGHGRSPTMVAAYLIRYRNKGVDEAIGLIKEKRSEIHIESTQEKALREFSKEK